MSRRLRFSKGHGTRNDFVILTDPDGLHDPSPAEVRFLCDRRAGVGGDGLLRVVRGRHVAGWSGDPDAWFMDYRNADGSLAEMCGNGVRVFLLHLKESGLVAHGVQRLDVGTRAGLRTGEYLPDGALRVWMGRPRVDAPGVRVRVGPQEFLARAVDVGNPHAVAVLDADADLPSLDLTRHPDCTPRERFPHDANFEFVRVDAPDEITMRVYDRGVGETFSCGTGTVAAACATASHLGADGGRFVVHVPGGTLVVELDGPDAYLTGPAVVLFSGELSLPDDLEVAHG